MNSNYVRGSFKKRKIKYKRASFLKLEWEVSEFRGRQVGFSLFFPSWYKLAISTNY